MLNALWVVATTSAVEGSAVASSVSLAQPASAAIMPTITAPTPSSIRIMAPCMQHRVHGWGNSHAHDFIA